MPWAWGQPQHVDHADAGQHMGSHLRFQAETHPVPQVRVLEARGRQLLLV